MVAACLELSQGHTTDCTPFREALLYRWRDRSRDSSFGVEPVLLLKTTLHLLHEGVWSTLLSFEGLEIDEKQFDRLTGPIPKWLHLPRVQIESR